MSRNLVARRVWLGVALVEEAAFVNHRLLTRQALPRMRLGADRIGEARDHVEACLHVRGVAESVMRDTRRERS